MIKEIKLDDYKLLQAFLEKDIGRNYFILLGLMGNKRVYDKIYGQYEEGDLRGVLFKRKSGTLQFFAPGDFHVEEFIRLISTLEYKALIGPRSYCDKFLEAGLFRSFKEGAYISKLNLDYKIKDFKAKNKIRAIELEDLDEIVNLYKDVFKSFSSKEIMEEKLRTGRGRGIAIVRHGEILSLAQTDFETRDGGVIVGVATRHEERGKGLASECIQVLSRTLQKEGKDVYLQYDNIGAGRIYESLGFKAFDQVIHYEK